MTSLLRASIVMTTCIFAASLLVVITRGPSALAQNYTNSIENQKDVKALENRCTDGVYREENPLACRLSDANKLISALMAKGVSQHCIDGAIFGSGVFGNDTLGKLAETICKEEIKNGPHSMYVRIS